MPTPEVSVIIPVLDSPLVADTLASVKGQEFDLDKVEILVIGLDNLHLVKPDNKVQFIETHGSVSEARNLGIKISSGKWLVFLDSDCVAKKRWLKQLVNRLEEGKPVVGGGVAIHGGNFYATCYNIATFYEFLEVLPPGPRDYLPTINLAMSREVAESVGGMDPLLPRAEDIDWTVRIRMQGYPLFFEPKATVCHCPKTNLRRIWIKWLSGGYCSRIVRQRYSGQLFAPSVLLNHPKFLLTLAPMIAFLAAMRIYWYHPTLLRYFHTWPIVFLTRIAWCLGAAAGAGNSGLRKILFPEGKLHT